MGIKARHPIWFACEVVVLGVPTQLLPKQQQVAERAVEVAEPMGSNPKLSVWGKAKAVIVKVSRARDFNLHQM